MHDSVTPVPIATAATGGDGAFAVDYLSYLESWVERSQAPNEMIGAHVDTKYLEEHSEVEGARTGAWMGAFMLEFPLDPDVPVNFTRPLYPYPLRAKYKGSGDPNKAENFEPVGP